METGAVTIKARISGDEGGEDRRRTPRTAVEIDARVRELGNEGVEAPRPRASSRSAPGSG